MIGIKNLSFSYPGLPVFKDLNLTLEKEKITCILGPSGCGKTTLFRLMAGFNTPEKGEITGVEKDKLSFLFQEPRLVPWMSVEENLSFILPDEEKISSVLESVGLSDYRSCHPSALSGGMKQRAAMARAFLPESPLLLMDEPFKSLDLEIKLSIIEQFKRLWLKSSRTVAFISHDIHAAVLLGDNIVIMNEKPLGIKEVIKNPFPLEERVLTNKNMTELEHRLFSLLLS